MRTLSKQTSRTSTMTTNRFTGRTSLVVTRRTIDVFIIEGRNLRNVNGITKLFNPYIRLKFGTNKKYRTQVWKSNWLTRKEKKRVLFVSLDYQINVESQMASIIYLWFCWYWISSNRTNSYWWYRCLGWFSRKVNNIHSNRWLIHSRSSSSGLFFLEVFVMLIIWMKNVHIGFPLIWMITLVWSIYLLPFRELYQW